jgi:uncharacterized protein (DUF427 family)
MRAIWRDATLAESDDTIVVEGNHYFPVDSINRQNFRESEIHIAIMPLKGSHRTFAEAVSRHAGG